MSQATRILLALVAGLLLGIVSASSGGDWVGTAIAVAEPVGGLWLDALRMTIVPLVVALIIIGIADSAEAARANRLAGRAILLFILVLWSSAILAALLTPFLLELWPMPAEAADALRTALSSAPQAVGAVPGFGEFLRSMIPTNPISAAANDAILPLIIFTTIFAFALTRIPDAPRRQLTGFFRALSDVMLVMIGWILWLAPIGVTALAFVVGARSGGAAFGGLLHYVLIISVVGIVIWLLAYPMAMIGGRVSLRDFARAMAPAQAVAISTQSSLASLPAMLRSAETLNVPVAASGVVLPLAVALFRATGPAMNLAVVIYVAYWFGMPLGPAEMAMGVAAAAITTMGAVSLPGQISFVTSIAPIGIAMGVPMEALLLLIAVETIPDIFRTLGNVTWDVAATATAARRSGFEPGSSLSEEDRLLEGSS
ncbi:dicarboxylate/amino acid:cation symporter [Sphingosinicella rhizophila]|uniref:Cation:dicarboxylase symporter family transporter n=1 Tax=Sphingosinicella rhizophila TaxID=3050082 RepID=A0ABU3Q4D8_9SPHN|nr:cation:dicarboxylase symporter family transporter [Sphingosinicella sp. GR2756]MDT9598283.1 cation:dicarboxylase symporter family transporter [Sphingosinicella sp. GR2756]